MSIFYTVAFWMLVLVVISLFVAVVRLAACIAAQDKVTESVVNYARAFDEWLKKHTEKH